MFYPCKIPVILTSEEVARLIEAAPGPKYKAMFAAAYGAGLRVSEVVALKITDIDSPRMLIRVEQGKGRKDRYARLSPQLLELLRDCARLAHKREIARHIGPAECDREEKSQRIATKSPHTSLLAQVGAPAEAHAGAIT